MKDRLSKLEVLALDFQATQADPEKRRLLEVGWMKAMVVKDIYVKVVVGGGEQVTFS